MKIHVKEAKNLSVPATATSNSAGYDVVALEDPKIVGVKDGDYWKSIDYIEYKTGLFTAPQPDSYGHNYHTLIFPRSSVRKYNLVLANSIGLIDNDYRGEIILCFKYLWQPEDFVILANPNEEMSKSFTKISDTVSSLNWKMVGKINESKIYKKGDKLGQLVAEVTNTIDWVVVADLSATLRGAGGFGSTTDRKVEAPKEASSLIDKWKSVGETPLPQKYEVVAKEREKQIS
jgi:dUTPase